MHVAGFIFVYPVSDFERSQCLPSDITVKKFLTACLIDILIFSAFHHFTAKGIQRMHYPAL
jgi:hypothetical protein